MKNTGKTIFGLLFIVWFIGSLIGVVIAARSEGSQWLIPVLFGQLFLFTGIMVVVSSVMEKKKVPWIIGIIMAIGAGVLTFGLANHFGSDETRTIMDTLLPILFGVVFLGVGLCGLIAMISRKKRREKANLTPVEATCVGYEEALIHGRLMRSPILEFLWNGEKRTVNSNVFTKAFTIFRTAPQVGEVRTLYIDGDNPDNFYDPKSGKWFQAVLYVLFTLFALAGIFVLYISINGIGTVVSSYTIGR